ncbi:hypothetical protein Val02_66690 [Virgisporangium aliadipatigenens]|uniref:Uncharacterized protein n=1 Tax=Virgisporangium aliadipatigenens TaxID=741659 RepID=A0A8J4DU77_9ACTN|nr:hypothetical protein [Virgisporangium aliadipatigenens]GIJ49783.1 hypothetical protein Val02_66690 [Virgisporangium aliadipatigenens]
MTHVDEYPVQADPATLADLHRQLDVLGTKALTAYARSLGIDAPDERAGWSVVLEYDADLNERGLFWVGPDHE